MLFLHPYQWIYTLIPVDFIKSSFTRRIWESLYTFLHILLILLHLHVYRT